jgi:DNA-binding CsgD family transcriptional regulator/tetratricopeptide (TPR) repeat protein
MLPGTRDDVGPLLGRDAETELLRSLLDGIESGGGALVLRGEPGIGKSRLLAEAEALAREGNIAVLRTTGVQSEAHVAFSGLHQLLRPVRGHAAGLLPAHRAALDSAFGLGDDAAPEHFRIAMAVLDLLSEVAADAPLLVIAEDAHWLDRPSSDVLAFVARRLESDPIVLLAAVRDGFWSSLVDAGLPEHRLDALDPAIAAQLLDTSARQLTPTTRSRILREAAGNPLALIELPIAAARVEQGTPMPGLVALTDRLEQAFAARISDLPEETRLLLLTAALNDEERLSEVLDAGRAVGAAPMDVDLLDPAVQAAIVDLDERTVRFRHPLMRSAVRQGASVLQRRRVHEALADALQAEPDRGVWHRAALIAGTHEDVAAELEEAGRRARRRGAISVAATALRRAAELSDPAQRAGRLVAAAEVAFELGQPHIVAPLLREAQQLEPGPLDGARATWIDEMINLRAPSPTRAAALIAAAEQAGEAGDRALHFALLWLVATRAWWADPGPAARRTVVEAASRLGDADDLHVLAIQAYADPFGHAPAVLARVQQAAAEGTHDTEALLYLGPAAVAVGAFDIGMTLLSAATDGLRADGRLAHLAYVLTIQGIVAARLADWDVAIPAAEEARSLAIELGQPLWKASAETLVSTIAGMRGDEDAAERASAEAERIALPTGANMTVAMAQFGKVSAALGASRHDDAYEAAERLFDPTDPAHHPAMASWIIGDLAEAALHAGRVEEARARVAQVEAAAGENPTVWIALGLRHARALLADDAQADERFEEALGADLGRWPFQRARLLLAHGQWLRRQRRITESRAPLRGARDAFDALGCAAFSQQARRELRASGESSRRRDPAARDQLTAQELQIAHLAAEGLSNREIGQQLYLSHRTIGTHLYRIFPKLGITARGELRPALSAGAAPPQR